MRVAVVAPRLGRGGGIERFTSEVAAGLADRDHSVEVVTGSRVELPGCDVHEIRSLPIPGVLGLLTTVATFAPRTTRALKRLGDFDAIYGPLGAHYERGTVTAHSCHAAWIRDRNEALGPARLNVLDRILLRQERRTYHASGVCVTTVSPTCADDIAVEHGVDRTRIHVVRPAVDIAEFFPRDGGERRAARAALGIDDGQFVIGTVANYSFRRKRVEESIKAAAAVGATLLVAGVPDRPSAYEAALEASPTADVRLLGPVIDMPAFYATLDGFVLPSINEAYGMAAHEAMARGIPTIVSDRCGVADFFEGGEALVVHLSDDVHESLTEAMASLRRSDPADRLAAAGASWATSYTWADVTEQLIAIIGDCDAP